MLFLFVVTFGQENKDFKIIRDILDGQTKAWNTGNLEKFMEGYWKSDDLTFIGSRGVTKGWQKTLDNYKKGYPNQEVMGKLTFTLLSMEKVSKKAVFVIGKWHLKRKIGDVSGHFSLLWKKIKGKWVIVADHSN